MERVQVLIDRLTEQKRSGETAAQLLVTVQLLHQELVLLQQQPGTIASKKIAVVMPAPAITISKADALPKAEEKAVETTPVKSEPVVVPRAEPPKPVEAPKDVAAPVQSYTLRRPSITELLQEKGEQKEPALSAIVPAAPAPVQPAAVPQATSTQPLQPTAPAPVPIMPASPAQPHFDIAEETPTLLQHTPQEEKKIHKEINQIIHGQQRSLNDQLKQQKTEVAHLLQDAPIKDLRKAIGINDKFVFLAELFNADEAMYERSIKTINNFHVLQEAEYWINRELKLRLGWNDTADTVQHFYGLVRRRFS